MIVLDRKGHPMMLCNSCVRLCSETGEQSEPYYFFSISDTALRRRPWRTGTVYLLPGDTFQLQPPLAVGDLRVQIAQAASTVPVKPMAKLAVGPEDFPFLEQIRGHDEEAFQARMAADPDGFPWVEPVERSSV